MSCAVDGRAWRTRGRTTTVHDRSDGGFCAVPLKCVIGFILHLTTSERSDGATMPGRSNLRKGRDLLPRRSDGGLPLQEPMFSGAEPRWYHRSRAVTSGSQCKNRRSSTRSLVLPSSVDIQEAQHVPVPSSGNDRTHFAPRERRAGRGFGATGRAALRDSTERGGVGNSVRSGPLVGGDLPVRWKRRSFCD